MIKLNSLNLLLAALLLGAMTLTACGDDTSSSSGDGDGDMAAGDGDGDMTAGDGDGDGAAITCDAAPCEGMSLDFGGTAFPLSTCCISADECGIDATMIGMGCVTLDTVAGLQGGDAGM